MKTEQDYRVTFEVAKLMKQAGFNWLCNSKYSNGIPHEGLLFRNTNISDDIARPLTPMALDWAESLGYKKRYDLGEWAGDFLMIIDKIGEVYYPEHYSDKEVDMAYLTAVCNHIINNKNEKGASINTQ